MDPQPADDMARKLNTEETTAFAEALRSAGRAPLAAEDEVLWQKLINQHDTALTLSPELEAWLGEEFPPPFHS